MGMDAQSLRLLLRAKKMGANFDSTLTLGRQDVLVTPAQIVEILRAFDITIDETEAKHLAFSADRFSEPLLYKLGAKTVDSIDASDFEGATIIQDLNRPFSNELNQKFTLVFDGGTLEHVFNFPIAVKSCMETVSIGGHFILVSPNNNQMGHGFYQFGPDVFYRIFSQENGFEVESLFLVSWVTNAPWYKVADPAEVRSRVEHNTTPGAQFLFCVAHRTQDVPIFAKMPQQSDYSAEWTHLPDKGHDQSRLWFFDRVIASQKRGPSKVFRAVVPGAVRRWRRSFRIAKTLQQPPNPAFFDPTD